MIYTVVWWNEARQALSRLRAEDLASAKLLASAVRMLAANPYPEASNRLGGSPFWRMRLAEFRIVYEVDDSDKAIYIYSIGRVSPRTGR